MYMYTHTHTHTLIQIHTVCACMYIVYNIYLFKHFVIGGVYSAVAT